MTYSGSCPRETATFGAEAAHKAAGANPQTPHWAWHSEACETRRDGAVGPGAVRPSLGGCRRPAGLAMFTNLTAGCKFA